MEIQNQNEVVQLTAEIVSAFVSNNEIESAQLGKLIEDTYQALVRAPALASTPEQQPLIPAVPIKKSVTPDYIVSLEDGRKFKSLKRYLRGQHNLTPDEYRAKWGLPRDYPMVAPNYAKSRSELAKRMGLGRKAPTTAPAKKPATARKRAAKKTAVDR